MLPLPIPRKKKRPADMNELAFDVVADLAGETAEEEHEKAVEKESVIKPQGKRIKKALKGETNQQ